MDRVLKGTAATASVTFYEDGVAVDPGTVTVTITSEAGQTLTGGATAGTGAAARTFALTTTHTALLDNLTLSWASTTKGTLTTRVEIVGGFVFSIPQARAFSGLGAQNNDSSYRISTARLLEVRTAVEQALEDELGFALVPRFKREVFDGDGGNYLMLSQPYLRTVRSVTVAGTALGVSDLAAVAVSATGRLYSPTAWTAGFQNVVFGYEHGLDSPPGQATQVALMLARRWATGAPADDRATTMTTDEQTTTFYVPGAGEPFDVPAANRYVAAQTLRTGIA